MSTAIHFPRHPGSSRKVMDAILADELEKTRESAALNGQGVEVLTRGSMTIVRASDAVPAGRIWYDTLAYAGEPGGEPCS